jgi:hypothetical protein
MLRVIGLALLVMGCGDGGGGGTVTGSCDTRAANSACSEYVAGADVVAQYKSACTTGTWKDGGCDKTGTVGGCKTSDSGLKLTYTNWFFAPQTTAGVMAACSAPSTYVSP